MSHRLEGSNWGFFTADLGLIEVLQCSLLRVLAPRGLSCYSDWANSLMCPWANSLNSPCLGFLILAMEQLILALSWGAVRAECINACKAYDQDWASVGQLWNVQVTWARRPRERLPSRPCQCRLKNAERAPTKVTSMWSACDGAQARPLTLCDIEYNYVCVRACMCVCEREIERERERERERRRIKRWDEQAIPDCFRIWADF